MDLGRMARFDGVVVALVVVPLGVYVAVEVGFIEGTSSVVVDCEEREAVMKDSFSFLCDKRKSQQAHRIPQLAQHPSGSPIPHQYLHHRSRQNHHHQQKVDAH
jgi:hypothetical protein